MKQEPDVLQLTEWCIVACTCKTLFISFVLCRKARAIMFAGSSFAQQAA